jgi:hypothetical protein
LDIEKVIILLRIKFGFFETICKFDRLSTNLILKKMELFATLQEKLKEIKLNLNLSKTSIEVFPQSSMKDHFD